MLSAEDFLKKTFYFLVFGYHTENIWFALKIFHENIFCCQGCSSGVWWGGRGGIVWGVPWCGCLLGGGFEERNCGGRMFYALKNVNFFTKNKGAFYSWPSFPSATKYQKMLKCFTEYVIYWNKWSLIGNHFSIFHHSCEMNISNFISTIFQQWTFSLSSSVHFFVFKKLVWCSALFRQLFMLLQMLGLCGFSNL